MSIRDLDTPVLAEYAKSLAAHFVKDEGTEVNGVTKYDRTWVMKELYNLIYKDEFEFVVSSMKTRLGTADLADIEARVALLPARSDADFFQLIEERQPVNATQLDEQSGEGEG